MAQLPRHVPVMAPPFSLSGWSGRRWEGGGGRGTTLKRFVLLRQLKCLLGGRGLAKQHDAVDFSRSACLSLHPSERAWQEGRPELELWSGKLNYLLFASIEVTSEVFSLCFHAHVQGEIFSFLTLLSATGLSKDWLYLAGSEDHNYS